MVQRFKGRNLTQGQKVQVYYNINKGGFSIRDKETGRVVAHGENILLRNAKFKVSSSGRERVISEGVKNVHAWIEGEFVGTSFEIPKDMVEAYYNPFKTEHFKVGYSSSIYASEYAYLANKKAYCDYVSAVTNKTEGRVIA